MFSRNLSIAIFVALMLTTVVTYVLLPTSQGCAYTTLPSSTKGTSLESEGYSMIARSPAVGQMGTGQADSGSAVIGASLYLVGGYGYTPKDPLSSVSVYSYADNHWVPGPDYPIKAWGMACTAFRGSLFCFGGSGAGSRAYKLDNGSLSWTRLADMPSVFTSSQGQVAISDPDTNKIYILGSSNDFLAQKMTVAYDVANNSYSRLTDMPFGNAWFTAGLFEGKIYTIGGIHSTEVLAYDVAQDSWSATSSCLPGLPKYGMMRDPGVFHGLIPIVDGRTPGSVFSNATLFYDIPNNRLLQGPPTLLPRDGIAGGIIENHLIVVGGRNDTGTPYGLTFSEALDLEAYLP